jgi:hypothetical protein
MPRRFLVAAVLASVALALSFGTVSAHPDNDQTRRFVMTCDDGNVWNVRFVGGAASFHLEGAGLYIWKQIEIVTPTGESAVLDQGIQGFSAAPLVVCTYTGAVTGNAYTVTGFYPPAS